MNADVRALFGQQAGFDPREVFGARAEEASRRLFWISAPDSPTACRKSGWPSWIRRGSPSRIWIWC